MARRKENRIELAAALPWSARITLGLVAYVVCRHGLLRYPPNQSSPVLANMGHQQSQGAFTWNAWALLAICWIGALVSYIKHRQRRRILDTQTGVESLRAISWREFEMLVGEAFRRQGYAIEETGLGGADGGIDLVLRKRGSVTLVQCKQWRNKRVDVRVAREMFGLMSHHGAQAVKIVCVGDFTPHARRFVQGKPIELIHGHGLLEMVRAVQTNQAPSIPQRPQPAAPDVANPTTNSAKVASAPECPRCRSAMVQRSNRRTGEPFWGCSTFPGCRGMRPIDQPA